MSEVFVEQIDQENFRMGKCGNSLTKSVVIISFLQYKYS